MVKYHPDTRFLTDYTAGSLPESQALCVASHLHHCSSCRAKVSELTELGSELFMTQRPEEVSEECFENIMAKLDEEPAAVVNLAQQSVHDALGSKQSTASEKSIFPKAIDKLTGGNLEKLKWRRVGSSFRFSTVNTSDSNRETSLLHIKAGGNVPSHRHSGDEITVILKGSFSDQEDQYHVGDFIVRTSGESHTPVASQDEDCLCIATLDTPIKVHNPLLRLMMPLFNRPTTS